MNAEDQKIKSNEPQEVVDGPTEVVDGATKVDDQAAEVVESEAVENVIELFPEGIRSSELEEARKSAQESQERFLRVQADFDNFRRRSRTEKEVSAKYASQQLIEHLLPVVDNFERALSSSKVTKDFDSLIKGIEMTSTQLEQILSQEGLKPIESVGVPFNPDFHQAIHKVESDAHEEGIILEEIQKGYMLKDKVLRPALVKVSM